MSLILDGTTGVPVTTVTGTLPVANGGTGGSTSTGTGAVVLATSPTLVTPALGTPSSGTLTNCTGVAAAALPAGSVLQVVSTTKTDVFTDSSGVLVAITGMSVQITPSSASNKIIVQVSVGRVGLQYVNTIAGFAVYRNGVLNSPIGDAAGSRPRHTFSILQPANQGICGGGAYSYQDSPATTSAMTYALYGSSSNVGEIWVFNKAYTDTDGIQAYNARVASTITVMEIKG